MSATHDDETPRPRQLYNKPGWSGAFYRDARGGERCSASWVAPCPHCHRPLAPEVAAKQRQAREAGGSGGIVTEAEVASGAAEVDYATRLEWEEAAATAHANATVETEELQYVYAFNEE